MKVPLRKMSMHLPFIPQCNFTQHVTFHVNFVEGILILIEFFISTLLKLCMNLHPPIQHWVAEPSIRDQNTCLWCGKFCQDQVKEESGFRRKCFERTGSVGASPFSREQGDTDIQLAPDGRAEMAEKDCVIGKAVQLLGTICSTALLFLLSCHYLEIFSRELCSAAAASLESLLLCMVPLFPTVHTAEDEQSQSLLHMAKDGKICLLVL